MAQLILLPGKERSAFKRHPWLFAGSVGRVSVSSRAMPAVMPVRYSLVDDRIFFWADPHDHPAAIADGTVSKIDPATVAVKGVFTPRGGIQTTVEARAPLNASRDASIGRS